MTPISRLAALLAGCCLLCPLLTAHCPLSAQPTFFEPKEHYYKAKGRGVSAAWEVPRPSVEEGRDLAATLVVTGATNPTEIEKPDLKKLPAFDAFTVTPVADAPRKPDDKAVRFNYKLRPRNRSVDRVPALEFYYFNPSAAPGKKQFPSTVAVSVPIAVTDPPPRPVVPMPEPDRLFHVATGSGVLGAPLDPCWWGWTAAGLIGPLVALGWFLAWRRVYPDARRLARMRRSRAARRALDAIRRAGRAPDPAAAVAGAVLGYLRTRFPLPESAATPSEVAAALVESRVPAEVAEQVAGVFRACDHARFALSGGDAADRLGADAGAAITRLEELA